MATRQYIGARYLPKIMGDWDITKDYEPLMVVYYNGASYTSKTYIPAGTAITNTTYWALSADYNAQVAAYRAEVLSFNDRVDKLVTNIINVMDYGADDSGNTSSLGAFTSALNDCNDGDMLYAPEGDFTLDDTLAIDKNIDIVIKGVIKVSHNKPVIALEGLSHTSAFINKIEKDSYGSYDYTNNSKDNSTGVLLDHCFDVNLKVRNIVNTLIGVQLYASDGEGCYYNNISVDYMDACCYGYDLISNEDGWVNANTIHNTIWQCHSWHIPDTNPPVEAQGCFVRNHGYKVGDTPYLNNYNIFENLMCEFASDISYHPTLVDLEYARGFYITFTRVELPTQAITQVGHTSIVDIIHSINCFVDVQGKFDIYKYNITDGCGGIVSYSEFISTLTGTDLYNYLRQRLSYRNVKLVAFDGDTANFLIGANTPVQGFATIWNSTVVMLNLFILGRIVSIRLTNAGTLTKCTEYYKDDTSTNIYASTVFGTQSITNRIYSGMIPLNGASSRNITIVEAAAPNVAALTVSDISIEKYSDGFEISYPYDVSLAGAYVKIKYNIS